MSYGDPDLDELLRRYPYLRQRFGDVSMEDVPINGGLLEPQFKLDPASLGNRAPSLPGAFDNSDQVSSLLGGMADSINGLAEKSTSESFTGTTQKVDPERLDAASNIFDRVYQRLMRRGLI